MADHHVGTAYVDIVPSTKGIANKISSGVVPEAEQAGQKGGLALGGKLVGALTGAIAAAGIGKVVSDAISAGADLEQQIGGVETLFAVSDKVKEMNRQILADSGMTAEEIEAAWQEPINTVLANAQTAFREAGMSQNEYMETVNGFAAALNQATGDVGRSADVAQMAVVDMSDNANKMGTSIDAIKNAYSGFAKQNYTMLDNLKLGYGGTADEMARLINDAGLLGDKIKVTSKTVKDVPLDVIMESIHEIQTQMGITGTTAREAATTFSGSLGMLSASWQNVLAAMTLGEGLDTALSGLGESLVAFGSNAFRLIGNLVTQIPSLLSGMITQIAPQIIPAAQSIFTNVYTALTEGLPQMMEAAQGIITNIGQGIQEKAPELLARGGEMIIQLVTGLMEKLPELITKAGDVVTQFVAGLMTKEPEIQTKGFEFITKLVQGIISNIPEVISAVAQVVGKFVATVATHLPEILQTGITILLKLLEGILNTIPRMVAALPQVVEAIKNAFNFDWASIGRNILEGVKNGIIGAVDGVVQAAKNAGQSIYDGVKGFFKIGSPSKLMADDIGAMIPEGISEGITGNTSAIKAATNMSNAIATASQPMMTATAPATGAAAGLNVSIVVNPSPGMDETELARKVNDQLQQWYYRRDAALA